MAKKISKKNIQKESKIITSQDSLETDRAASTTEDNSVGLENYDETAFLSSIRMAGPSISSYQDMTNIENARPDKLPGGRRQPGNTLAENIGGISSLAAKIIQATLSGTSDILNALTGTRGCEQYDYGDSHCSCHHEQAHPCCHEDHHVHYHDSCCHDHHGGHSYVVSRCNNVRGC